MDYTSWINGLIGGLLIGFAGTIYLLFNGRIMGASGIVGVVYYQEMIKP